MKGKIIVLEGVDGVGKATQTSLLVNWLAKKEIPCISQSFPDYGSPACAPVEEYLHGGYGENAAEVNPYAVSTMFAVDRFASYQKHWKQAYENGYVLVCDRYTTSNAVLQGGKLPLEERPAYWDWLYDLEFNKMGLPKPDLVLYLDAPIALTSKLMDKRQQTTSHQSDIHEADIQFLKAGRASGMAAADYLGWDVIQCFSDDASRILSIEEIQRKIVNRVQRIL